MLKFMDLKEKKGITILALSVTIIILLILAGISVATLTGDNGLIANAGKAKEQAEIDNEKEVLNIATTQAMGKNKYGNVTQSELSEKLDTDVGERKTEVIDNGDTLAVKFVDSGRYYEVDNDGNVSEPVEIVIDEYAGDLTKGGRCDGTEEKPYEINCIEDLVAFSIATNGGNSELKISSSNFNGKYVILTRSLDFKSIFSYNDYTTKEYGDLNIDGIVEDIKTELTKTDEGCIGFTPIGNNSSTFGGIFNGKGYKISNIYENINSSGGLFGNISNNSEIKNISVSGIIISTSHTGGIVGNACPIYEANCVKIENCINEVNIQTSGNAGGIVGLKNTQDGIIEIENCYNLAKIQGGEVAGGIVGHGYKNTYIKNCYNSGEIIATSTKTGPDYGGAGGIVGLGYNTISIENCYNKGKVTNSIIYAAGGILGSFGWHTTTIKNCYNVGEISAKYAGGIIGGGYSGTNGSLLMVENCYYIEINAGWGVGTLSSDEAIASSNSRLKSEELVNLLNSYIESSETNAEGYDYWIYNTNNYPTLDYKKIWNGLEWKE